MEVTAAGCTAARATQSFAADVCYTTAAAHNFAAANDLAAAAAAMSAHCCQLTCVPQTPAVLQSREHSPT